MNRVYRIAVELLCPPLFASLLLVTASGMLGDSSEALEALPVVLMFAYLIAGIPSLLFAIAMELSFHRGLKQESWSTVRYAGWFGVCAGALIGFVALREIPAVWALGVALPLGGVTGTSIGLVIRKLPKPKTKTAQPGATDNPDDAQRLREAH